MSRSSIENWRVRETDDGCYVGEFKGQEYDSVKPMAGLVIGNGATVGCLGDMAEEYSDRGTHVIVFDVSQNTRISTIDGFANRLASVIETETGTQEVMLIGHSFGGVLAQVVAAKYPGFVDRVGLLATVPRGMPAEFPSLSTTIDMARPGWYEQTVGQDRGRYEVLSGHNGSAYRSEAERRADEKARENQCNALMNDVAIDTIRQSTLLGLLLPRLPVHKQPTVIIAASDDPYSPPRNPEVLHRRHPNSVLYTIEGDHMFPKKQPAETVRLLEKGFDELR